MPHQLAAHAGSTAHDFVAGTVTMAVPVGVSGWMLMGHSVEDWVVLLTLAQLFLTLPYWLWRITRETRIWPRITRWLRGLK
jgi:hypothetical protein